LLVNPMNIAQLVNGDPQRLVEEAQGAVAFLLKGASASADSTASRRDHLVPVIRQRNWLDGVSKQFGTDLLVEGLAVPFGEHLIVTFAFEYDDRREPMTANPEFEGADFFSLLALARANQERMLAATPGSLLVTELVPTECNFFLRSTNLQAASLILSGLPQHLAAGMNSEAASALLGIVVSPEVIAFRAAGWDDVKIDANLLVSNAKGLRKAFGVSENWGVDVFKISTDWPALLDYED
jgi:hypothetical protein